MFFFNAQLILWYCNVSLWLENGQTADFVPLNTFCIASSRLPVLKQTHWQRQMCFQEHLLHGFWEPRWCEGIKSDGRPFTVKQK